MSQVREVKLIGRREPTRQSERKRYRLDGPSHKQDGLWQTHYETCKEHVRGQSYRSGSH